MKSDSLKHPSILLLLLSIADTYLTLTGISGGYIREANPLMNAILEMEPAYFFAVKLALPAILVALSHAIGESRPVRILMNAALIVYVTVFLLHAFWIALI
ncbi:hypothetical protein SAMN04488127_1566 [Bhargavaea ginsengi]|uniref:DUF5658 domain-containing protein n=1 Tax=Bhargavaea ginsengi TaxID=426757 RepID=A0A1H6Y0A1_9BACL|nr:DUF5658 family protein [Bhargavaea ginsengi]MCM3086439.1 DUF5658 family protein [Bhargavaea ginsengi]SEJ30572.1 hypothetical protein SAMN04488127_1566 [Bhargavaea ginsengi]